MSAFADHVVITSKDRLNFSSTTAQNFTVSLQNPVQDFEYFQLIWAMIPNTFYNVTNVIGNSQLVINGVTSEFIAQGNYNLNTLMTAYTDLYSGTVPGFNIVFDPIAVKITVSATSNFTMDFSNTRETALTLGFLPILYSGSNQYISSLPPSISPLGVLINMDCVQPTVSTSNLQGLRSSSFMIPNSANQLDYLIWSENSFFTHSVRSNFNVINTITVTLYDMQGNPLVNVGDWNCVLRFVRRKPQTTEYKSQKLGVY